MFLMWCSVCMMFVDVYLLSCMLVIWLLLDVSDMMSWMLLVVFLIWMLLWCMGLGRCVLMVFSWFCILMVVRLVFMFCLNVRYSDVVLVLFVVDVYSSFGVLFILCLISVVIDFLMICVDVFGYVV